MDSDELKSLQAPLKARYREAPQAAVLTLKAEGLHRRRGDLFGGHRQGHGRGGPPSRHRRHRLSRLLRRHAAPGPRRLRRRHPECRGHRPGNSLDRRHGAGRRRSRFPRHPGRGPRGPRGLPEHPPGLRSRRPISRRSSAPPCSSSPNATAWSTRPCASPRPSPWPCTPPDSMLSAVRLGDPARQPLYTPHGPFTTGRRIRRGAPQAD